VTRPPSGPDPSPGRPDPSPGGPDPSPERDSLDARLVAAWPRLEPLIDELLDLPDEAARVSRLQKLASDDPELGALGTELYARMAEQDMRMAIGNDAMSSTVGGELPALLDDAFGLTTAAAEPAERWGPYRRLRSLGQGGTGHVFLAERDDGQFQQQVAVKVLRTEVDTALARERLKRERQLLARLDHPGISRLIDGGIGPDGRPWFAMEHVEGEPITTYVRRLNLGRAARLELFGRLLTAVRYLHQNLVVHRDLKPANVLVTASGDVRVLDLGIARILDDSPVNSATTQTQAALTPAYAAPEQILGRPTTTAVDVFALGLLLHELITTRTAFPDGRFAPDAAGDVAALRTAEPAGVDPDLDAIIARALRPEPGERYPSVESLDEDLARYRQGSPVAARRGGWRYRASKSLRRHRVAWAAMAALVVTLTAGLLATLWQARVAREEAGRAAAVSRFLLHIFEGADPEVEQGPTTTARTLLDRGTGRIRAELATQPALRAEMLHTLGGLYSKLGEYDEAWKLLDESWRLRQTLPDLSLRERLASMTALGQVQQSRGRGTEAESLFRASIDMIGPNAGRLPLDLATAHNGLASILNERGQGAVADSLARLALEGRRRHGADDLDVAESLNELATISYDRGRYDEARQWFTESLALFEKRLGHESLRGAALRSNLATVLIQQGRPAEAEPLFQSALEVQRRQLGPDHPRVAISLAGLAGIASRQDRLEEAEPLYAEVLRINRRTYGARHPDVAKALHDVGRARLRLGRMAEADSAYRECLSILTGMLGPNHPFVGKTLSSLADLQRQRGDRVAAQATFRRSLDILTRSLGPEHELTAQAGLGLGRTLLETGHAAEAEPWLRAAYEAMARQFPADDARVVQARGLLEMASPRP